jgi:hypothetical protein
VALERHFGAKLAARITAGVVLEVEDAVLGDVGLDEHDRRLLEVVQVVADQRAGEDRLRLLEDRRHALLLDPRRGDLARLEVDGDDQVGLRVDGYLDRQDVDQAAVHEVILVDLLGRVDAGDRAGGHDAIVDRDLAVAGHAPDDLLHAAEVDGRDIQRAA